MRSYDFAHKKKVEVEFARVKSLRSHCYLVASVS
jgi:hypothetical protein